jgi:hypothetical protein
MERLKTVRDLFATVLLAGAGACAGPGPEKVEDALPTASSGWTRTPDIRSVVTAPGGLTVIGVAQPGARVALRSGGGVAYAAAADAAGRFEIRIAAPKDHVLLQPETQIGQEAAISPDLLVVLDEGRGPVALLRAGGAARRLDDAPALGAVDSDGRSVLASGRSGGAQVSVSVPANDAIARVRSGLDGAWTLLLSAGSGEAIRVEGETFTWPGPGQAGTDLVVERAGEGWRIGWSAASGARQWTWLPTRPTA